MKLPLMDTQFSCLQEKNPKIRLLCEKFLHGLYKEFYFVENDFLYRTIIDNGNKFNAAVVPEELTDTVIFLGHNQSGHNGYQRTYTAIKHSYYWKGMRKHVLVYCKTCVTCPKQQVQKPQFEQQIFKPGVQPMEFICINLIGEFHPSSSKVNRYALTAVCRQVLHFVFLSRINQQKKSKQHGEIIFHFHLVSAENYSLIMEWNLKMNC